MSISKRSYRVLSGFLFLMAFSVLTALVNAEDHNETEYFVGMCSCIYGQTAYRTQFELVNEESFPVNGRLSFFDAEGEVSELKYQSIWTGEQGSLELVDGVSEFIIPGQSTLVILTVPELEGGLGWAKLEKEGPLHIQASLQTAKLKSSTDDFDQTIQYQAELHSIEASKKIVFPVSLYAGMKHLSTAFTMVNLSGTKAKLKVTFRPDIEREIQLDPGELLADYFERFWPLAVPAIFPLQIRGTVEVTSDTPLAVGVFRTINGYPDLGVRTISKSMEELREPTDVGLDSPFELRSGQPVKIGGSDLGIELWDIAEDSRCPVDVVCVWEGRVLVDLDVTKTGENRRIRLSSQAGKESVEFGGYQIKLLEVEPSPVSTEKIEISEYVLRLIVSEVEQ